MTDTYKVRIVIAGGGTIHLMSQGKPAIYRDPETGRIDGSRFQPIADRDDADTLVAIDWDAVSVVTYRPSDRPSDRREGGRPPETSMADVLRALARYEGELWSKSAMADAVGVTRKVIDRHLPAMLTQGLVIAVAAPRGRIGYRLTRAGVDAANGSESVVPAPTARNAVDARNAL